MIITATAVGVQGFKKRFNNRPLENAPALAYWRCNLVSAIIPNLEIETLS